MKITRVTTAVVEANFDWTFIKIETNDGIAGYGEAFFGPGLTAIIREFSGALIGEDPTSFERLMRRLRIISIYMSAGLAMHVIGGIETALLDIVGKKFGLPVWQLLGGKYRNNVAIYADCHGGDALESIDAILRPRIPHWARQEAVQHAPSIVSLRHQGWDASESDISTPEAYAQTAERMAARGFKILKFDVDVPTPHETDEYNRHLSSAEIDFAATLIRAVRDRVQDSVELAVDCHWNYSVDSAVRLAFALEDSKLLWLEDPVPPENLASIGKVQSAVKTPVATGENNYFRIDFDRLLRESGLRVLSPDVQKVGVLEGRRIADLADMHHANLTWHNISSPIGTMAGVHLAAATPNFLALEWHAASIPFFDELIKGSEGQLIREGKVAVPDKPGLGILLDEDVAYKYRKLNEPFFE